MVIIRVLSVQACKKKTDVRVYWNKYKKVCGVKKKYLTPFLFCIMIAKVIDDGENCRADIAV